MTATEINSTPTEVTAPAPTAQITNNDISFVLKASPVAPEKQAASVLSTQNRIEQKYKFAKDVYKRQRSATDCLTLPLNIAI